MLTCVAARGAVALIGASGDPKKNTSRPQRFLRQYGYAGKILPVTPGRDEVLGEKAYPSILDVPGDVDHAFIMVPTYAVEAALVQCVEKKVAVATIYSDGFAETGAAGRVKQEKLVAIAKKGGVRLIGPNCIGLFSSKPACALSVNAVLEKLDVTPGPLAIVSQSGSMMGGLLSRGLGRGVGFSKLISSDSGIQLLDVRTAEEFGGGHLANALNIDWYDSTLFLLAQLTLAQSGAKMVVTLAVGRCLASVDR